MPKKKRKPKTEKYAAHVPPKTSKPDKADYPRDMKKGFPC